MVAVALLVLLLLALAAAGALWRANHRLRTRARAAEEADPVTGLPGLSLIHI